MTSSKPPLMDNYTFQPIALARGKGCRVWDESGKQYLDFTGGMATAALGHAHPAMIEALTRQAGTLIMCPASYLTAPRVACAQTLVNNSCFDKVFFCNSGTEAVEAALKLARKWAYETKGVQANEIIAFRNAFHGRTYGALAVTEKSLHQPYFAPHLAGVHFAPFNDLAAVEALISAKTAAIIVEPVQGEGGLTPAHQEFLQGLRTLCDTHNVALIFDEIQCGMGRLGTLFAYESFGVEPDMVTLAKGLASGVPIGALVAKEHFAKHFTTGSHGTTFGGNPLSCAVSCAVMGEMLGAGFLDNVRARGAQLREGLEALATKYPDKITRVCGMGLMIGFDTPLDNGKLRAALQKAGLLTTQAGASVLRLTPPLIVSEAEVMEALEVIDATLVQL